MSWPSKFFRPVDFQSADAAAYRRKAANRDIIFFYIYTIFVILTQSSRLLIEFNITPDAVEASILYRLGAILCMLLMAGTSITQCCRPFYHAFLAIGLSAVVILTAIGNAKAPSYFPYALTSVWIVIFLLGVFSFCWRLVILVVAMAVLLPRLALALANVPPVSPVSLIVLDALVIIMTLAVSYAAEQFWRRAFKTELKLAAAQEEQRRVHHELAAAYATLKDTQAQLVAAEKTAALARLVANVAHRINTPIGNIVAMASHIDEAISRFSDLITNGGVRRSDLTALVNVVAEGNGMVLSNGQRAAALIDMFKTLAIADRGEPPQRVDIGAFLGGIRPALEALLAPAVTLVIDAPPRVEVMAQWHILETVVEELALNAATHAFAGGRAGTLTIQARTTAEGDAEIQVIDDGNGIAPEHREHVFDPFYTDGSIGGGGGLGLSIVHNAVFGSLGGQITLDSHEGRGTIVTIRLPAANTERRETA